MAHGGKLALVLILTAIGLQAGQPEPPAPVPPIVMPFARITPEGNLRVSDVVGTFTGIGSTPTRVWATISQRAVAIDPAGKGTDEVTLPGDPCGPLAADFDAVWVPLCSSKTLARIDGSSKAVTTTPMTSLSDGGGAITTAVGSLWIIADARGTLQRIDPDKVSLVAEVYLPAGSSAIAFGSKALWVAGGPSNTVLKIDPHTNLIVESIDVPGRPTTVAVDGEAVWALATERREVVRIDTGSNKVAATIALGLRDGVALDTTTAVLAASDGVVWVSATGAPLIRIEARTNRVTQVFTGGVASRALAVAHRSIWMARPEATLARIDPRLVAALR